MRLRELSNARLEHSVAPLLSLETSVGPMPAASAYIHLAALIVSLRVSTRVGPGALVLPCVLGGVAIALTARASVAIDPATLDPHVFAQNITVFGQAAISMRQHTIESRPGTVRRMYTA